jgi:adenine phosphoribosyltransferase
LAIVDDVLATGGTVAAACQLVEGAGAEVDSVLVVLELAALGGRSVLGGRKLHALQVCQRGRA